MKKISLLKLCAFFALLSPLTLLTAGCSNGEHKAQGYVDTDLVYVAPEVSGRLEQLLVKRGYPVQSGQKLFVLEQEPQLSELREAQQNLSSEQATLANMYKGDRPLQLAALRDKVAETQAELIYAKQSLARYSTLARQDFATEDKLDQTISNEKELTAQLAENTANYDFAKQGAREDLILAQQHDVMEAQAAIKVALWNLEQKSQITAPTSGLVFDTYYWPGEAVKTDSPIVAIQSPQYTYVIFYVRSPELKDIKLGQTVHFTCQSCSKKYYPATITYISPEAEYAPPVIYSRQTNAKLLFKVRARMTPAEFSIFHPGQPVTVNYVSAGL